ncbi:MAG: hypothetical protein KIT79_12590 [Deltaproteobacteria bacterium]|nr:hypothetical protein [Deltaproteobacteria bacterium]
MEPSVEAGRPAVSFRIGGSDLTRRLVRLTVIRSSLGGEYAALEVENSDGRVAPLLRDRAPARLDWFRPGEPARALFGGFVDSHDLDETAHVILKPGSPVFWRDGFAHARSSGDIRQTLSGIWQDAKVHHLPGPAAGWSIAFGDHTRDAALDSLLHAAAFSAPRADWQVTRWFDTGGILHIGDPMLAPSAPQVRIAYGTNIIARRHTGEGIFEAECPAAFGIEIGQRVRVEDPVSGVSADGRVLMAIDTWDARRARTDLAMRFMQ